jgi:hypothetical protein
MTKLQTVGLIAWGLVSIILLKLTAYRFFLFTNLLK